MWCLNLQKANKIQTAEGKTVRQIHQYIIPKNKKNAQGVHNEGVLTTREQLFILTLVRMRKGLD